MKKILVMLMTLVLSFGIVNAKETVTRDRNALPAAARTCLTKNFPKLEVNHIKIDSKLVGGKDYDVVLSDGTEIEFDAKGNIKEIDRGYNAIPDALVLKPIRDYVAKNFKNNKIVELKVERNKYEIGLSNGMDLEFDRAGKFLRIDD